MERRYTSLTCATATTPKRKKTKRVDEARVL